MRLLQRDNNGQYSLTNDLPPRNIPPYAILSHTWGAEEVIFIDLSKPSHEWQRKVGFEKIEFCAEQAKRDGIRYFWVDTCCIDKSDPNELRTAINSMFAWYRTAERCYVYLPDVSSTATSTSSPRPLAWEEAFQKSRWFTRGWTLQELIAPQTVEFYSHEGIRLGDKRSLEPQIRDITNIPADALRGTPLSDFTVSEREAWARNRQTTLEEDMAYCLLGIFDINMPMIYGEGQVKAQRRLQEEIQKAVKGKHANDFSILFSLAEVPETQHFVARQEELAEMRRALSSDGSRRIVSLHGLGGIGKTQLAVAYIKHYRDEYSAIFWLSIKDEASIQQSFTKVARQILQQHPHASHLSALDLERDHDEVVEAVKAWLSLPDNTRWLVVYDNYDNPKLSNSTNITGIDIQRFLPMAYQGSIIVTTRLSQIDVGHRIRITKLTALDDSLKILSATSGREILGKDMDARRLVEKLDGLPLALATAGAYLRHVPISLTDYFRHYEKSWTRIHAGTPNLGSYQDRTINSTWQISYEHVEAQNPLAAQLLRWWAYFDNEDIWFELFQSPNNNCPAWMQELTDELNFNGSMGILHSYGFVEPHSVISDHPESSGYSIHSCLHSWATHVLNQDWNYELGRFALSCVASRVPSQNDPQFWVLQRRLLPHAIKSCTTIDTRDQDLSWAFYNLGGLYADQGKLQKAEEMYLRALRGYEKAWGPDYTSTLDTVNNLGLLYSDQGKMQEAEEMYLRALRGNEKAWGPDHTSTLYTVNNLAGLYKAQGKMQEAEEMCLRALRGKEKAWGPDHTSTLDTVNNLGLLYSDQGKMQEAEEMYLRALRGYEKAWGPDHTSTLDTVNNLGLLYSEQSKMQEAEEMYLRALRGYEKAVGPQILTTYQPAINTTWNLGLLLKAQGKSVEARQFCTQALARLKVLYGTSHPEVRSWQEFVTSLSTSSSSSSSSTESFGINSTIENPSALEEDDSTVIPTASRQRRRDAFKAVFRRFKR